MTLCCTSWKLRCAARHESCGVLHVMEAAVLYDCHYCSCRICSCMHALRRRGAGLAVGSQTATGIGIRRTRLQNQNVVYQ